MIALEYDALNQHVARRVREDGHFTTVPDQERYFVYENGQIAPKVEGDGAVDLSHRYLWGPAVDQFPPTNKSQRASCSVPVSSALIN